MADVPNSLNPTIGERSTQTTQPTSIKLETQASEANKPVETKDDTAEILRKKETSAQFDDFLRFLRRRRLPAEFLTKIIAEHVEKRLKSDRTDLWKLVNERFQRDPTRRKIFVRGIDFNAQDEEMEMVFSQFGQVERLNLMRQADNRSKGFGFIMYKTAYGARAAVAQKSVTYKGRDMQISAAIPEHLKAKRGLKGRGRGQFRGAFGYGGGYGGFGGYGRGFAYRRFYGAFPYQGFGRGRGALWNQQWQNLYHTPAPPMAASALPVNNALTPEIKSPSTAFSPYSSISDPTNSQRYAQAAAGVFQQNATSNPIASEQAADHYNASVSFGSAAAYYAQAATQTHLTQPVMSTGQTQ